MITPRAPALLIAGAGSLLALQPTLVHAQWWSRGPRDFEECAAIAEKSATKEDRRFALAECNAKFAGRRKPGGGYTYYDFLQDRSFDIAGPNPTPEEQKKIDEQYTVYLEKQRRNNIAAAFAVKQQQLYEKQLEQQALQEQHLQQVSLRSDSEKVSPPDDSEKVSPRSDTKKVPLPQQRPKVLGNEPRARPKPPDCSKDEFSCNWPRLSASWSEFKKLFSTSSATKPKKG